MGQGVLGQIQMSGAQIGGSRKAGQQAKILRFIACLFTQKA